MNLYFESVAMILTIVTVGKYLEVHLKSKTTLVITLLLGPVPKTSTILRNGEEITLSVEDIAIGDFILVRL